MNHSDYFIEPYDEARAEPDFLVDEMRTYVINGTGAAPAEQSNLQSEISQLETHLVFKAPTPVVDTPDATTHFEPAPAPSSSCELLGS